MKTILDVTNYHEKANRNSQLTYLKNGLKPYSKNYGEAELIISSITYATYFSFAFVHINIMGGILLVLSPVLLIFILSRGHKESEKTN